MRTPPRILAVDDVSENLDIVQVRLEASGYDVVTARDGEEALIAARKHVPDLILLDIMMPKLDGISVLKELKRDTTLGFIPVILLTAKADRSDIVAGLDAGGDDYLTKPFDQAALVARVRSMLRIKSLHDLTQAQATALAKQAEELADWNHLLEGRVASQVEEIERMARLKRFLPPQVADIIAASDEAEARLESHRREVTVLFCDLRGFTAFTEASAPEQVMEVLTEFRTTVGTLIDRYEGTLERFAGDGLLTLFNDPLPHADHADRAVRLAIDIREEVSRLVETWRSRGHALSFGIGVALGAATIGRIGTESRFDYSAVGSVVNLGSRLCDEAKPGQILVDARVQAAVASFAEARSIGELALKGFRQPVEAFEILGHKSG